MGGLMVVRVVLILAMAFSGAMAAWSAWLAVDRGWDLWVTAGAYANSAAAWWVALRWLASSERWRGVSETWRSTAEREAANRGLLEIAITRLKFERAQALRRGNG